MWHTRHYKYIIFIIGIKLYWLNKFASETLKFTDGPVNVVVAPEGPNFQPGTVLTCRASGDPSPNFAWIDLSDNSTTDGPQFTVPGYNEGGNNNYEVICKATNEIRSQTHTAYSDVIDITVISK